jgi:hypothetical protein
MTANTKRQIDYEVLTLSPGEKNIIISLAHREGRLPIAKSVVTAYGEIELHCADGAVEVLGSGDSPCPEEALDRIRNHHEGLHLIFMVAKGQAPGEPDYVGPFRECHIKAPLLAH